MQLAQPRQLLLLSLVFSTALYGLSDITVAHAAILGSFTWNPQYILAGGNNSFTGIASGGTPPYKFNWTFGDGPLIANGSFVTHIYKLAGSYTAKLNITDAMSARITVSQTVSVQGSPLSFDGWVVNWNMRDSGGIEISDATYNSVLTIKHAFINGILVRYAPLPNFPCNYFFDDLGRDDLNTSIAGLTVQFSPNPPNPWFQIRAAYNPALVGYNYTQYWRFYTDGRWDAIVYEAHEGCASNHTYQPHWRIDLAIGNKGQNLMSQYTPSGVWQNLIWEGNYTDNGFRDPTHNSTQWRVGDGHSYYYIVPTVYQWAGDLPRIAPKIYLVRDRPGEIEPTISETPPTIPDPIMFVNGELAYRQSIAFWYLPTIWDHWLTSPGPSAPGIPPSLLELSFYPYRI